jgi:hypothetical protein
MVIPDNGRDGIFAAHPMRSTARRNQADRVDATQIAGNIMPDCS